MGHPVTFYVQMSIVAHVVTIDILDLFYAQMSIVTDVVTFDILYHLYAQMSTVIDVVTIDILDHFLCTDVNSYKCCNNWHTRPLSHDALLHFGSSDL